MDDAKKLIHWAVNLKKEYNVEITSFDWPQRFSFNLLDYNFKFRYNNQVYNGRGSAESSEIALVKAIVEAIERTVIYKYKYKNSNGIAAHFDYIQAAENAICELIERDIFLCNYLWMEAGVNEITNDLLSDYHQNVVKEFKKMNVNVCFYELGTLLNRTVILVITNGFKRSNPFGCVVGLGASLNKEKAIETALCEAARNTITYIDRDSCAEWYKSENDFFNKENKLFSILDHGKLALTETYGRWLWNYFLDKKKFKIYDHDIQDKDIEIIELNLDHPFSELGIKVAHARSDRMQNLFFHKTTSEKVNLVRLQKFANSPLLFEDLNLRTHPIS